MDDTETEATSNLYDRERSSAFYESRYTQGYMDDWPPEKKRRVIEVVRQLPLPSSGNALDFGCGNGVLTEVVREALPEWNIYGTDFSKTAVTTASSRHPNCTFFDSSDTRYANTKFDFLFTNHVVEHVYDLEEVIGQMAAFLKPKSSMLHFLPCGNPGSFEHGVCLLRDDGINRDLENRFFYEDKGHVRRLTSLEFQNICKGVGFGLDMAFYSNQYDGAIEWITGSSIRFIRMFSDSKTAVDLEAKRKLKQIRVMLLTIGLLRSPVRIYSNIISKQSRSWHQRLLLLPVISLYPLAKVVDHYVKSRAEKEWRKEMSNPEASEMCLFLKRHHKKEGQLPCH